MNKKPNKKINLYAFIWILGIFAIIFGYCIIASYIKTYSSFWILLLLLIFWTIVLFRKDKNFLYALILICGSFALIFLVAFVTNNGKVAGKLTLLFFYILGIGYVVYSLKKRKL